MVVALDILRYSADMIDRNFWLLEKQPAKKDSVCFRGSLTLARHGPDAFQIGDKVITQATKHKDKYNNKLGSHWLNTAESCARKLKLFAAKSSCF